MRKVVLFSSLLLILSISLIIDTEQTVHANGTTYEVGVDNLLVRDDANSNASVIGSLKRGDKVTVFKEKHGWAMTYFGDQEAWIAAHFLVESKQQATSTPKTQASTKEQSVSNTVTVTTDGVRLRSGSGLDYKVVGFRDRGDKLKVINTQNDWHQVQLSNGNKAWIAAWLTSDSSADTSNANQSSSPAQSSGTSLAGKNIVLDPGHGGYDPGSTALNGVFEKRLTSDIAQQIGSVLESYGATVIYTRSSDQYVSLFDRVRISNAYWTDAFISIHFNAFTNASVNGVSTHYYGGNDNYQLATAIQNQLAKQTSLANRGVQPDNYYVLRENNDPSVLLELGFLTNESDLNNIMSDSYRSQVAESIANGLANYFN